MAVVGVYRDMKRITRIVVLIFAALAGMVSCDRFEGEVDVPAYLKIDSMYVVDNPSDSWSQESGFFTSSIDAVNIVVWAKGDTAEIELGTFQLPCKVPVLKHGMVDKVRIMPVVKQDGIAGKRIYYPYYQTLQFDSVRFAPDSVTDFGTLTTKYISRNTMKVVWQEYFEPGPSEISLDSAVMRCYSLDTVRSGYGCGVVRVKEDETSIRFWADTTFDVGDATSIVYLEMDYWSDIDLSIGLYNPTYSGGPNNLITHMTIYGKPERGWQKIYINIGSLWSQHFNHYQYIRPYFTVLNSSGKSGNVFIDNIKLLVM